MPNCRNCGARLSKFDADICPVCGITKPLEGIDSETVEITSQIFLSGMKEGQRVIRHRKTMAVLFYALGWTAAPFFYIKKKLFALLWLLGNLIVLGGLFSMFFFGFHAHIAVSIIVPFAIVYVVNAITGTIYYFAPDIKDGDGEFIV